MKVKFLRTYGKYKIGEKSEVTPSDSERKYLLSTGTIEILEDDVQNETEEDIPNIPNTEVSDEETNQEDDQNQDPPQDEEEKAGKGGKRGSKK